MNRLIAILLLGGWATVLPANNIRVSQVTLSPQDTERQTAVVEFNLGWENSWRTASAPVNWDAAWVFVKYRVDEGAWRHASLSEVATAPATCTFRVSPDGRGAFAYRTATGAGSVQYDGLALTWDCGTDGVAAGANVSVQVFAVEMVYVPGGKFYLGSGGRQGNEFYPSGLIQSNVTYQVLSEDALLLTEDGGLSQIVLPGLLANVPAAFPKGYEAFYCMKYETSQRQFVSFYNSLTAAQRTGLDLNQLDLRIPGARVARNGMAWSDEEERMMTSAPDVPVSSLSVNQLLAYLDWSGLRPMTEMEFEKACRGSQSPVPREYAWGTDAASSTPYVVSNPYESTEQITNMDGSVATRGNGLYATNSSLGGPLRSGIFAAGVAENTRAWSGGSYYGIMELSGNLSETVVTASTVTGRTFVANHGDGELDANGTSGSRWPTLITAYGIRGGSYAESAQAMQVSYRPLTPVSTLLSESIGFRGIRSSISQ